LAGLSETEAAGLRAVIDDFDAEALATLIRDLRRHDLGQLLSTLEAIDDSRPSVVRPCTSQDNQLAPAGHPGHPRAPPTEARVRDLAAASGMALEDPWVAFAPDTAAGRLCAETAQRLRREAHETHTVAEVPAELGFAPKAVISTQAALGRFLSDLKHV